MGLQPLLTASLPLQPTEELEEGGFPRKHITERYGIIHLFKECTLDSHFH